MKVYKYLIRFLRLKLKKIWRLFITFNHKAYPLEY